MRKFLVVIFVLAAHFLLAQEGVVQKIRKQYNHIAVSIAACTENEKCSLYQNKVVINSLKGSWRGSGNYGKTIIFWYVDHPKYCDECGEKGVNVLQKVEVEENVDNRTYYSEFLFAEGELVFHYCKTDEQQMRWYFENGKVIRKMKNSDIVKQELIDAKAVLKKSEKLQKLFVSGF